MNMQTDILNTGEAFLRRLVSPREQTHRKADDRKPNSSAASRAPVGAKEGMCSVDTIRLEADSRGSFSFTFSSSRGELSGRVNVGTEGPPDRRSTADKEQAAKNQILALARELAQVCE
jgi:hypothetical protein